MDIYCLICCVLLSVLDKIGIVEFVCVFEV